MKKFILLFLCVFLINSCSKEDVCEPKPTMGSTTLNETGYSSISVTGTITPPTCDTSVISQGFVLDDEQLPTINKRKKIANGTSIQATFDDLLPNTTYYIRTFLTNVDGDYYGPQVEIKTQNPTVNFSDVGVEQSFESASFSAKYSFAEGAGLNVKEKGFEVDGKTYRDTDSANGLINITVENLSTNKSYDYNAYVITDYGNYYSDINSFNTNDPSSTVSNLTAKASGFGQGTFSASYENNYSGTDITSKKGFMLALSEDFSAGFDIYNSDSDTKTFELIVEGLKADGTKYYVKAYVENPYGTYTSEPTSFETLNAGYNFKTNSALDIFYDSVNLKSEFIYLVDNVEIIKRGFLVSENENMENPIEHIDSRTVSNHNESYNSVIVDNLKTNKKYYFQSFVENEYGLFLSEVSNFVTKSAVPNFSFDVIDESIWFDKTKANFSMTKPDDVSITSFNIDIKNLNSEETIRINYLENYSDYSGGAFEYEMTNLHPNTNYTVTMILVNPYGTFESDNYSFTTKDDKPFMKSFITLSSSYTENQVLFQYNIKEVDGDISDKIYLKYKNNEEEQYVRVNLPNETNETENYNTDNQQVLLDNIVMGPEYEYILHYENEWNTHTFELYHTKAVTYEVGDEKFGGIIIYIDQTGYHGRVAVKPSSYSSSMFWSSDKVRVNNADETGEPLKDEDGSNNTQKLLDFYKDSSENSPAADYADNLEVSGYNDWYLPTTWEINKLKKAIDVSAYNAWTVIEAADDQAWGHFRAGNTSNTDKHSNNFIVIPIRKF
jgi:hypothetical protein